MGSFIRRFLLVLAAVVLLGGAGSTYADTILNYQVSGPGNSGAFDATFTLLEHPTPSGGGPLSFWFSSLPVTVNGTASDLTVVFDSSWTGGGVLSNAFLLVGPQLYSWPSSSSTPTMSMGSFQLFGVAGNTSGYYTVSVIDPPPGRAPEPATLSFLVTAFLALLGSRLFRRAS